MFTGIIKKTAQIKKAEKKDTSLHFEIETPYGWGIGEGDSIAVDGACLTAYKVNERSWHAELMPETLEKTYFGTHIPQRVNLEQSLRAHDGLDGHLVMGHIDTVGSIRDIQKKGDAHIFTFSFQKEFAHLVASKGSIAINGTSLTPVDVTENSCTVSVVTYTMEHTTINKKETGSPINIEFDILAKYVAKHISRKP